MLVQPFVAPYATGYAHPLTGFSGAAGLYFDSAAAGPGDGTLADPYTTLSPLNALVYEGGDLGGATFYLAKGSTFFAPLHLKDCSNVTISAYGTGNRPVISSYTGDQGTTNPSGANWVDYTGTQADTYYMTAANWGGVRSSILLDGIPLNLRDNLADLLLAYERASTGADHKWTYWYDWANTEGNGVAMYVHCDPAVTADLTALQAMTIQRPRTSAEEQALAGATYTTAGQYPIKVDTCSNITFNNIDAKGGFGAAFLAYATDNLALTGVYAYYTGAGWVTTTNPGGQNAFNFLGVSKAARSSGLTLTDCVGHDCQGANSNCIEIFFQDDVVIDNFTAMDCRGNGIEFWTSSANWVVKNSTFMDTNTFFKFFDQDEDTIGSLIKNYQSHYENLLFFNNVVIQRRSYLNAGGTDVNAPTGGYGCLLAQQDYKVYSNVRVVNNTFYLDDNMAVMDIHDDSQLSTLGDGSFTFRNNVILEKNTDHRNYAQSQTVLYATFTTTQAALWTVYNNIYTSARAYFNARVGGAFCPTDFAFYLTKWDLVGDGSGEDGSSYIADATNLVVTKGTYLTSDLHPYDGSAAMVGAADITDPDYPDTDKDGVTRSRDSAGAYD